jgi:hypothetical protein
MIYIKINQDAESEYPYSIEKLKLDFPDISFPEQLNEHVLNSVGIYSVKTTAPDHIIGKITYEKLPELIEMVYTQVWDTREPTLEEEINQANYIRDERKNKLSECDWTQVADAPVDKIAWQEYRQQLRDITSQDGFPWDVIWPESP